MTNSVAATADIAAKPTATPNGGVPCPRLSWACCGGRAARPTFGRCPASPWHPCGHRPTPGRPGTSAGRDLMRSPRGTSDASAASISFKSSIRFSSSRDIFPTSLARSPGRARTSGERCSSGCRSIRRSGRRTVRPIAGRQSSLVARRASAPRPGSLRRRPAARPRGARTRARPRGPRPLPACPAARGPRGTDRRVPHHPVKPADHVLRQHGLSHQEQEGLLHHVFRRLAPLLGVEHQRRAMLIEEPPQEFRACRAHPRFPRRPPQERRHRAEVVPRRRGPPSI